MLRAEAIATAETALLYVQYYAVVGAVVAGFFLLFGVARISPKARNSYLFRLLVLPGVVGLWPVVVWRWYALEKERRAGGDDA
jgi:hypothetical protein